MATLYKYSQKKYSDLLLNEGGVRIGTLYDFRKDEHGSGISDAGEGFKRVEHRIDSYHTDSYDPRAHSPLKQFGGFRNAGGAKITMDNCTMGKRISSRDLFIHCTSYKLDQEVMGQFDKADSCVRILRDKDFYAQITLLLNKITPVKFVGIHRVRYLSRVETWNGKDWGENPALFKEVDYQPQHEVRAIWVPLFSKLIKPVNIVDGSLRQFCDSVEV